MRLEYTIADGVALLTVTGELDLANAKALREAGELALTDPPGSLRIDLAGVTFIDSTGVSALAAIRNKAEASQHTLVVANPSARVLRVLEVTGLLPYFQIR